MLQFKDRRLIRFGERVRAVRQESGLSLEDVARESSVSRKDLQSIEDGGRNFGFTTFLSLCKGLGVSPSVLMDAQFED